MEATKQSVPFMLEKVKLPVNFVETVNAETLETIDDSYRILFQNLGIAEFNLTNVVTLVMRSSKETIRHLQRLILRDIRRFLKWLTILIIIFTEVEVNST